MHNLRQIKLQNLEEELDIIRSLFERFWDEMSKQQQDYLGNIEQQLVKEIRILEKRY